MNPATIDLRNSQRQNQESNNNNRQDLEGPGVASRPQHGKVLLSWEAPEYVVYKKSTGWYIAFGIILALSLFAAFMLKSFLMGVIVALGGILIFVYSERKPQTISYDIRTRGIRIGDRIYPYKDLMSYNIIEREDENHILIKSKRTMVPLIHVPLGKADPDTADDALIDFLEKDDDLIEPMADILAHWLGF